MEEVDLRYTQLPIAEIFYRQLKENEFDLSDMSISFYLIAKSRGNFPYVGIPVFPMREFFHSRIVVNSDSQISKPEELQGKRFGLPEYAVTASLWTRAALQHEFGVALDKVEWFIERPVTDSLAFAAGWSNPSGINVSEIPREQSLVSMLNDGQLDAAFIYRQEIQSRMERSTEEMLSSRNRIKPLFADQKTEAKRYYRSTGFYPINHLMILRESLANEYPWLPYKLFQAFETSKRLCLERNKRLAVSNNSFVWLDSLQAEVYELFGDDPFPYGLKKNAEILRALAQFSFEQHLTSRKLEFEEMFHESVLDT